ncbi:26335_t:CDS:2, partial [Gigaspora rosea]
MKSNRPWTTVYELVTYVLKQKGVVLYYEQPDTNAPEDTRNFGFFCFGIDGKYDLNSDSAPIFSLVVEDSAEYGTPIAFGISNKENSHTIRIAVKVVQQNILCNSVDCSHEYYYEELSNSRGFARIQNQNCAPVWQPFAMIDKHRPSKQRLQPILRGLILCWFHIMQTFVGRSRSKEEALELGELYQFFIKSLPITEIVKEFL